MSRIYWDTMLFVYWLEGNQEFGDRIQDIWKRMEARGDQLCTSVFTLGELLVGHYRTGALDRAEKVRNHFEAGGIEVLPFGVETVDTYGRIRGTQRVSTADAIHLACAAQRGVDLFLTNDHRLQTVVVPGIDFIAGMDVNLF